LKMGQPFLKREKGEFCELCPRQPQKSCDTKKRIIKRAGSCLVSMVWGWGDITPHLPTRGEPLEGRRRGGGRISSN